MRKGENMETLEAIGKRASLKTHISPRDIEPEKIARVLDSALLAPSARNMQPWRFIVVRGRDAVETLVSRAFGEGNSPAKEAPVIIVACANPADDVTRDGKEYYLFDLGLAMENLLLAATDLGLVTHPMSGIDEGELKKVLGIPPEVRFVAATPLAYPTAGSYDEAAQEKLSQRTRKGLKELVYIGSWGESQA